MLDVLPELPRTWQVRVGRRWRQWKMLTGFIGLRSVATLPWGYSSAGRALAWHVSMTTFLDGDSAYGGQVS